MTDKKQPDALQYADRDHMALGDYYLRHVSAMTGEALHAKSAIAAELAHRDREIDRQHAELEALRMGYAAARLEIESLNAQLHAAKQINAAQFGLLAASIPGSARPGK